MKKWIKRILNLFIVVSLILLSYATILLFEYQKIKNEKPIVEVVKSIQDQPGFIQVNQISDELISSIIATEDRRFYERSGFDLRAFVRAMLINIKEGEALQGGSTIPQQVAKLLYFDHEQDLNEKVIQVYIMYDLESLYTKDEILELYLNLAYFGSGYTGVYQASHGYFDIDPKDLAWPEATLLAGVLPAPSIYDPTLNFELAKQRQYAVLSSLVSVKKLSQSEADKIFNQNIELKSKSP